MEQNAFDTVVPHNQPLQPMLGDHHIEYPPQAPCKKEVSLTFSLRDVAGISEA